MKTPLFFLLPLGLLAGVITLFIVTDGAGLASEPPAPMESLDFERIVLVPGGIELRVRNTGPDPLRLSFASVRDMVVPMNVDGYIPRMDLATVTIPYPWVEAEAYEITLFSSNSIPFSFTIEAATATKETRVSTLIGFTLIGLYVGVIPVFLGILWLPALRKFGPVAFTWLMALTVGLLIFLGIDAVAEALKEAGTLGPPFQGPGLIGIGMLLAFMSLLAITQRRNPALIDEDGRAKRVALMISVGIGLHNFGEGLAIGSAFGMGSADLGTFFVIGFIIQNITEGLGIIAPIIKQKPSLKTLAGLGLIGGAPAIAGAWIGGLTPSPAFSVFALALGAGAVFGVAGGIGKMIAKKMDSRPIAVSSGIIAGMALLYSMGLLIK